MYDALLDDLEDDVPSNPDKTIELAEESAAALDGEGVLDESMSEAGIDSDAETDASAESLTEEIDQRKIQRRKFDLQKLCHTNVIRRNKLNCQMTFNSADIDKTIANVSAFKRKKRACLLPLLPVWNCFSF